MKLTESDSNSSRPRLLGISALVLRFRFAWIGKSSNGGGKLFDLQSRGSNSLHGHGFVLRRRSLCSYFDSSSTASYFSSSLHDSTISVRLHFHRRLSPRLRSNPSYKKNGFFTFISSLWHPSRSYLASCGLSSFIDFFNVPWINGLKVFVIGGFMGRTYVSRRRLPFGQCHIFLDKIS